MKLATLADNEIMITLTALACLLAGAFVVGRLFERLQAPKVVGEIIGGSQREDKLDVLEKRMQECGLKPEEYDFYLDLRRYGSARHAGFGLGFERCVMYLTGMGNIRDVIPFPRTVNNCDL